MHRFHRAAGTAAVLVVGVVGSLGLAACESTPDRTGSTASASSASAADPSTLRVLAGSEVKDMAPILEEARQATGVTVELHYAGTLDGAEQVASGGAGRSYDATWFSSNRYLGLLPGGNQALASSTKVMASPVVLGVRPAKATELGWDRTPPTWAQISQAAAAKKFTYGMTNPATSNSGFSALVGVATALAGGGSAIDGRRVAAVKPQLTQFFSGQRLTSGSSGWLAERFLEQSANGQSGSGGSSRSVDGLINYESVLLGLGEGESTASSRLTLVRPKDGVVSADYPLSLLTTAQAKRGAYQKLADWLRTPDAQRAIMQRTHRRPVVPGVPLDPAFGRQLLVELPFPAQRSTADGLIATYLDEVRRPSQTIYVLDVSGSMNGDRITQLKRAFATLSGQDVTGTEQFTTFRPRERVTVIPFSDEARQAESVQLDPRDPKAQLGAINREVSALQPAGGTAIYSALDRAYQTAREQVRANPDTFTSVVLMTDGEKTAGIDAAQFLRTYDGLPDEAKAVPTFTVLFGESDADELREIATRTHGKVFDARTSSLPAIFKEIRGYQ